MNITLLPPYGQVFQTLLTNNKFDASLIWTLPENISPTFNKALQFEEVDCNQICDEVIRFQALINFSESHEFSFVIAGHFNTL